MCVCVEWAWLWSLSAKGSAHGGRPALSHCRTRNCLGRALLGSVSDKGWDGPRDRAPITHESHGAQTRTNAHKRTHAHSHIPQ